MVDELKSHSEELKKSVEESRSEMTTLTNEKNDIQTQVTTLTNEKNILKKNLDEKNLQLIKTGSFLNKMTNEMKKKNEVERLKSEMDSLEMKLKRAQQRVYSLSEREEIQRQRASNTRKQIEESLPGIQTLLAHLSEAGKFESSVIVTAVVSS